VAKFEYERSRCARCEPVSLRGSFPGSVKKPNEYKIRTTPVPDEPPAFVLRRIALIP
jgi:hypothetical protein